MMITNFTMPRRSAFRQIAVAITAMLASLSMSAPAGATDFGPTDFPLSVLGVHFQIPVTVSYDSKNEGTGVVVTANVTANLRSVQDKALDIARAVSMPKANCAHQGINPVVNSIDAASIVPSGTNAIVSISGRVTAWVCKRVSGFTFKTELPPKHVAITITAPLSGQVFDHRSIGVALAGPVSVTGPGLDGQVLELLSAYFQDKISAQLGKALDTEAARAKLPALPGLSVDVASFDFAAAGSDLVIHSSGTASLNEDAFKSVLSHLNQ